MNLFLEQTLNGFQLGFTLLMVSAGLTLIFGIMDVINLAHGSLFMIGGFVTADVAARTGNFAIALAAAVVVAAIAGVILEVVLVRRLYLRDHLDQVLATFGVVLASNQAVIMIWGKVPLSVSKPSAFTRLVTMPPGIPYPSYRLVVTAAGIATIGLLHLIIGRTRIGMWIRAGTTHRELLEAFGINIRLLYTFVFALGAALAGFAGAMYSPLGSPETGGGDHFLILSFVVIVIGGIGSLKGAMVGSLILGLVDTWARTYLPRLLESFMEASSAATVGASLASASIYLVMIIILVFRPNGLYGLNNG